MIRLITFFIVLIISLPHFIKANYFFNSDYALPGLIAKEILRGNFPIYLGEHYQGTLESFFHALLISLFGTKIILLNIFPTIFTLVFFLVLYKLIRLYYEEKTANTVLLISAFLPLSLAARYFHSHPNVIESLTIGFLAFYLYLKPINIYIKFTLIPFILALGFWLYMPFMNFIVVIFAFLVIDFFLNYKNVLLKIKTYIMGLFISGIFFLIGYIPAIYYIKTNDKINSSALGIQTLWGALKNLKLFHRMIKFVYFDVKSEHILISLLSWICVGIIHISIIYSIYVFIKTINKGTFRERVLRLRANPFVIFFFIQLFAFIFNIKVNHISQERWIPGIYYVLILMLVLLLNSLKKYKTQLALLFFLPLILFGFTSNYFYLLNSETRPFEKFEPYIRSLNVKGGISEYYWFSYDFTYYTNEDIILAYYQRYPISFTNALKYIEKVKTMDEIFYVSENPKKDNLSFEENTYKIISENKVFNEVDKNELYIYKLKRI